MQKEKLIRVLNTEVQGESKNIDNINTMLEDGWLLTRVVSNKHSTDYFFKKFEYEEKSQLVAKVSGKDLLFVLEQAKRSED